MTTWADFHKYLPSAGTFSKDPRAFGFSDTEHGGLISHGNGAYVWDTSGQKYLDWISGLGANLLGHSNQRWLSEVINAVARGVAFSIPTDCEYQAGKDLVEYCQRHIPGWLDAELQVRFVKTGTDALNAAVRLARAATGRTNLLSTGYHGTSDSFIAGTPPAWGIVPLMNNHITPIWYNDEDVQAMFHARNPAAVVIEQPTQEPENFWYQRVMKNCELFSSLLVMDEVVTGFRYAKGGACELYGITPDILCLGKGVANGMPVGAIVAKKELMSWFSRSDPVFISSTAFGNPVDLAAVSATLQIIETEPVVEHIWSIGEQLLDGLLQLSLEHPELGVIGNPPRSLCVFDDEDKNLALARLGYFIQSMRQFGVLMNRPNFPTYAHTPQDVKLTLEQMSDVLESMSVLENSENLMSLMKDRLPMQLFRRR